MKKISLRHIVIANFGVIAIFCTLFLCAPPLYAENSDTTDTSDTMRALEQLKHGVRKFTLSNGLRVILYRRGDAPVFSGVVGVRVGGTDEEPGKTGISHMFEHMAFKGSRKIGTRDYTKERPLLEELEDILVKYPPPQELPKNVQSRWEAINAELQKLWTTEEFTREYEKRGASGMNATTDTELTRYFVSLPRSAFEFWCQMESGRLLDPVIRQFYQERDVVMEERRMRTDDSPEGKLYEELLGISFLQHPYHYPVIGYANDIRRLTATDVEAFRRKFYVPSNIVVTLVGDVDEVRDRPMIERYFGGLAAGPPPTRPTVVEPPQEGERTFTVEYPSSPMMYIAYRKPIFPHPDDAPISVMSEVIAGSSISPLYTELVKKRMIASSISADEAPGSAYPNLLVFSLTPKSPHSNTDALKAFDSVIEKFVTDGPSPQLLEIAKRGMAISYLGRMKSSISLAIDLASTELVHGNWEVILEWLDQVLKVTPADVQRVAKVYLSNKSRIVGKLETTPKEGLPKN